MADDGGADVYLPMNLLERRIYWRRSIESNR